MHELEQIDINDSTVSTVTLNQTKNDIIVITSDYDEDHHHRVESTNIGSPIMQKSSQALSMSFGKYDSDDEIVFLDQRDSFNLSFEVEAEFQDDTMINSAKGSQEPQTQASKRSQSNVLDEIEQAALSATTDSVESSAISSPTPFGGSVERRMFPQQRQLLSGQIVRSSQYSSPVRTEIPSSYTLASSPVSTWNSRDASSQIRSYSRMSGSLKRDVPEDTQELNAHSKRKKFENQISIENSEHTTASGSMWSLMNTIERNKRNDMESMSSVSQFDKNVCSILNNRRPLSLGRDGIDSVVVDSDSGSDIDFPSKERPLFVLHSSQSTPVGIKTKGKNIISERKSTPLSNLERKQKITNSRFFSEEEYQAMVKKCLSTTETKQKYNDCNKVQRTVENIQAEMILHVNHKIVALLEAKNIDLTKELAPTTILRNYESTQVIWFRRKCTSIFDRSHGIFYPCDEVIEEESTCVLFYEALDFFYRYRTGKQSLWREIRSFTKRGKKVIVLLFGQNQLRKRLTAMENKIHENQVMEHLAELDSSQSQSKTRRISAQEAKLRELNMKSKDLDRIVNEIIVYARVDVFPIENLHEFPEWIKNLIWVVGKMRYDVSIKHKEWSHLNVRSGKVPSEVFGKFLQQIVHVNEGKAKRVVSHYPTFQSMLEDMLSGSVRRGSDGKALMMKSLEKALYTLYTSDDPNELIFSE